MSTYCFISKLRKGAGFSTCSVLPMLSVLSAVLIALQLLLSSAAYASSTAGSYTFGNSQPLDQASVSVVRFVVTYTATAAIPPTPECSTTTSTGLGVLVGSWPTTAGSTDFTNSIMTDGTLVDPQGVSCGPGKPTEALSSIQIYVNDAYTNATGNLTSSLLKTLTCVGVVAVCKDGTVTVPITCQVSAPCSGGVVLVPFHSTTPQPFIDVATADQTTPAPFGVGLTSPTPGIITPTPAQAAQLLTPVQVINTTDPKNELGMPIVNNLGQLLDMNTKVTDTAGSIRSYVTSQLSPGPVGQSGHTNSLRDSWNNGITAYYGGDYVNAQTDFRNAGTHNNLFRAGVAFWSLAMTKTGNGGTGVNGGGTGKTPTAGKTPGSNSTSTHNGVTLFGYSISGSLFTALVIGALVLLIIILALITFAVVRRQAQQRKEAKEYAELNRRAEADAAQIAQQEKEDSLRTRQGWNSPQGFNPVNAAPPMQAQAQSAPNLHCPNCGTPVNRTDNFCPNCRSPISLTDSGLNVRLNKPAVSSPLPAVSQASPVAGLVPSTAFSDMPTEEIPFGAVEAAQNGNEKTIPLIGRNSTPRSAPPVEQFSGHNLGLIVGTESNPGIKRQHKPNEDSIFAAEGMLNNNGQAPAFGLFVVADGMGGHANGQDASRLAIQTIVETLMPRLTSNEPFTDDDFAQLLADGVQKANMAVHQRNLEHRADMGTTMTATLIIGTNAYMANVGDSRTYLYRQPEGLKKITNDHSVVASLVDAGIIKPDDIYTHPKRNQIYRSLGEKPVVDVDTFKVPLKPGDKIILCSDGLWDMVRDPLIEKVLNTVPDPTQTRHALIQAALDGGGEDNVSVIVIHIADSPHGVGLVGVQVLAQPEAPQYPPM